MSACGGGGGGSRGSGGEDPGEVASCPANYERHNDECVCADHLLDTGEYCTDWAQTVSTGAEYLEPGFPAIVELVPSHYALPLYSLVGNIDSDPELEIVFSPGNALIFAWNHDGTLIDGWPNASPNFHPGKQVLADLDGGGDREVVSVQQGNAQESSKCTLLAYGADGNVLPGWPIECESSARVPPIALDLDGDGFDEVVYEDRDQNLVKSVDRYGSVQSHSVIPLDITIPRWCGFAFGDITTNQGDEMVFLSCRYQYTTPGGAQPTESMYLVLTDSNFSALPGFPLEVEPSYQHQPLIGDVDDDGVKEILMVSADPKNGFYGVILIISPTGEIERRINLANYIGDYNEAYISLADIDGDSTPEIIAFERGVGIHALKPDGTDLPGWPIPGPPKFAIGDIDGDQKPEIIFTEAIEGAYNSDVRVNVRIYSDTGTLEPYNITVAYAGPGGSMTPVIADVDLDGKNEVLITGNFWNGNAGLYPQLWLFELPGGQDGKVEWGQMMSDESNSGEYNPR